MDVSEPATVAMHAGTAAVIRVLAGADTAFTVRQLARMAELSPNRAHQVVERLEEHGLVLTEMKGRSRLCQLNRDHLAAGAVVELASLRGALFELLRTEIGAWTPGVVHASLFGSAARGDGSTSSDLDILVVRQDDADVGEWESQSAASASAIHRATGNWPAWFSLTRAEMAAALERDEPIVEEWRRDAIDLAGTSLRTLLRRVA